MFAVNGFTSISPDKQPPSHGHADQTSSSLSSPPPSLCLVAALFRSYPCPFHHGLVLYPSRGLSHVHEALFLSPFPSPVPYRVPSPALFLFHVLAPSPARSLDLSIFPGSSLPSISIYKHYFLVKTKFMHFS